MVSGEFGAVGELISNIFAPVDIKRTAVEEVNGYGVGGNFGADDLVERNIGEDDFVAVVDVLNGIVAVAGEVEESIAGVAADK